MEHEYTYFVGIDWGHEEHQVCIVGLQGKPQQRRVKNTGQDLSQLAESLVELVPHKPERVAVGIETPRGPVVETLLDRKVHVYALNPKQLDRFRDRHSPAGAKDDRLDAFVLATSLRTDPGCFRQLQLSEPELIQLREVTRLYHELEVEGGRLSNQFWAQLHRYWPELLKLCPAANEPWFWALWELAPSPKQAAKVQEQALKKLLKEHRIRRLEAEEVLKVLRATPIAVAPGVTESANCVLTLLLPRLRLVHRQQREVEKLIDDCLDTLGQPKPDDPQQREHRDVEIFRSMTGAGRIVVATMFAEASTPLAQRDYSILRAQSGVAPVTRQTGKQKSGNRARPAPVGMRYGCNPYLRNAIHHFARVSSQLDPHSKAHYQALRAAGHSNARALRGVGDRLLKVLIAMLKGGTLYDPSLRHQAPKNKAG